MYVYVVGTHRTFRIVLNIKKSTIEDLFCFFTRRLVVCSPQVGVGSHHNCWIFGCLAAFLSKYSCYTVVGALAGVGQCDWCCTEWGGMVYVRACRHGGTG